MDTIKAKDIVAFGKQMNKPIHWRVLRIDQNNALIASCAGVATLPYDEEGKAVNWSSCSLRHWLNNEFLKEAFSENEQSQINSTYLPDSQEDVDFSNDKAADSVFILSLQEATAYLTVEERRLLSSSQTTRAWHSSDGLREIVRWWLRDTDKDAVEKTRSLVCDFDGKLGFSQKNSAKTIAVRAAMWVNTDALRLADMPDIRALNIRLKEDSLRSVTRFYDYEINDHVLCSFVDYETQEEYVMLRGESGSLPRIAKISLEYVVSDEIEKKGYILHSLLQEKTVQETKVALQRQLDSNRVESWMKQLAWIPSSEEYLDWIEEDMNIPFGKKPGNKEPLFWKVLKRTENAALLVSTEGIRSDTFMEENDVDHHADWEHSQIRKWLNRTFYRKYFSKTEQSVIKYCITETGDALGRINPWINPVKDYVFLLSDAEINTFMPCPSSRVIRNTPDDISMNHQNVDVAQGDWWWTRIPALKRGNIICVDPDGVIDRNGRWCFSDVCAIRPALLLNLKDAENLSVFK